MNFDFIIIISVIIVVFTIIIALLFTFEITIYQHFTNCLTPLLIKGQLMDFSFTKIQTLECYPTVTITNQVITSFDAITKAAVITNASFYLYF